MLAELFGSLVLLMPKIERGSVADDSIIRIKEALNKVDNASANSASVEIAARAVISQWDELGPSGLEETIEILRRALQLHA